MLLSVANAADDGSTSAVAVDTANYDQSKILVQLSDGLTDSQIDSIFGTDTYIASTKALSGFYEVFVSPESTVEDAVKYYQTHEYVASAELNFKIQLNAVPTNDALVNNLWGMNNIGQTGGTVDADIDANEAWSVTTGSSNIIVAVIDTGIDYTHPDLAANIWVNSGEIAGNGIDDDGNGYVDDIHGYDFYNEDGDPMDDHGHGTHVSGTIGAVGNNGIGVAGVVQNVQMMALKFLSANGSGWTSDAVRALDYAVANGAVISNNSWGGGGNSSTLNAAIDRAQAAGHIFIAAAGNAGSNNDLTPSYPASYTQTNVISVAATDQNDQLAWFSNFGATSADVAAPGVSIYSTMPGNSYGYMSGTSMATPHVSGLAALVWSANPSWNYQQVVQQIYDTVDPIASLNGVVATGGRINAAAAVGLTLPADDHGNDASHATALFVSTTTNNANGVLEQAGDKDWFAFEATTGGTYQFQTTLGTLNDTRITVYGTDGTTVLASDDNSGSGLASLLQWTAAQSGFYFVQVDHPTDFSTGSYSLLATQIVTVGTPVFSSPGAFTFDATPTIRWSTTTNADHYELLYYNLNTGQLLANPQNITTTSYTHGTALRAGNTYQVWARAISSGGEVGFWSSSLNFTVLAPSTPTIILPGTSTNDTTPQIVWTTSSGADHYEVLLYDFSLGQQVTYQQNISATNYTHSTSLTAGHSYQTFVRGVNEAGDTGLWSQSHIFQIAAPDAPVIVSPANHLTRDTTPEIQWQAVSGANTYELLVYDLSVGQLLEHGQNLIGTTYQTTQNFNVGTNYQTFMRSFTPDGFAGSWSSSYEFLVAAPAPPTFLTPGSTTNDTTPFISWNAANGASTYEFYLFNLDLGSQVTHRQNVALTNITPQTPLIAGTGYQAFARGFNDNSDAGSWSSPLVFTVDAGATGFQFAGEIFSASTSRFQLDSHTENVAYFAMTHKSSELESSGLISEDSNPASRSNSSDDSRGALDKNTRLSEEEVLRELVREESQRLANLIDVDIDTRDTNSAGDEEQASLPESILDHLFSEIVESTSGETPLLDTLLDLSKF